MKVSCECGRQLDVQKSMAGSSVECECGQTVRVPTPSVKPPQAGQPNRTSRKQLTLRKKIAFTAVTLLLVAAPGWILLELAYRTYYSIPFTGGVIGEGEARLPEDGGDPEYLSRFRRSQNPILFYEPNPGVKSGVYSINSAGFRDRDYAKAKDPSVFRIVMLGDSIVWGHGLELQDTFAKQLESLLNEVSDQKFEVLNFGVSGYSTQQEVELFRVKAKEYDPDLVIVGYCLNDFEESSVEGEAFKRLYYDIFSKSYLYDHLKRVIAGVSYNQFGYMADAPPAQFDLREQFRLLGTYSGGRKNLVVIFPTLENFGNYLYAIGHRRIKDAIEGLNYEILDLLDVYRLCDAESLILEPLDRTHPNAFGILLAAQATLEVLAEKQLVPIELAAIKTSAAQLAREGAVTTTAKIDALRIEAEYQVSEGRFADAAEIAVKLSTLDIRDPVAELLQAFDWHLRGGKVDSAEQDLQRALELNAMDPRVHRSMAQLLNSQGRRYEAREHVIALARLSAITHRELLSLIDLGGPFRLVSFEEVVDDTSGTLFELGKARHQFIADENPGAALETLDRLAATTTHAAVEALRGRVIAEMMDQDRLQAWIKNVPSGIDEHPEYWLAVGLWLIHNDRDAEAVRALGEAVRLDPTDRRSVRAMSAALARLGETEKAKTTQATLATLDSIFRLATNADAEQTMWIAQQLQTLTRPWESVVWYRQAFQMQGAIESRADELNERVARIRAWENEGTIDEIRAARVTRMLGFDIRTFPLPDLVRTITPRSDQPSVRPQNTLRFRDVAESVGINTTFVSEYPLDVVDFYLYQANGGGLAALDYDLDGRCDLYVVHSGGDPNQPQSSVANQLFRQAPGGGFVEVAAPSMTADRSYGQGVCAGDLNQDGFTDVLVANIGRNTVYINQGDGTFSEQVDAIDLGGEHWTSSLAVGDLDGDQLPEIVEINYLDDPLIFQQKCLGKQLNCTPQRFRAATDRIFRTRGDGTYSLWQSAEQIDELPNYGFGAVIANFDAQAGNDVFISNDGDVNHYWKSSRVSDGYSQPYQLQELAGVAGCGIGKSGISQACMGIASGDFDRNGLLDLMITNFHNEPVNLFLQNDSGFFVDEALKYGLAQPSKDVLGFGTQAADFDNDGWLDLAVLNGHIYDASYADIPFRMVSQLFRGSRGAFSLQDAKTAGTYWDRPQLARTLALWDFNRDGRMDLVASHLDQPIAILQNNSEEGNWLQLELVGVASERDAIGAGVVVHAGGERWSGWQTGGDGYMCTNEPLIHFGIGGGVKEIEKVEIDWPSGTTQVINSIQPNARYLVVEGESPVRRGR